MMYSYRVSAAAVKELASLRGARVELAEVSSFKDTPRGMEGLAFLVGLDREGTNTLLIFTEQVGAPPIFFPGLVVSSAPEYTGDRGVKIESLKPAEQSLMTIYPDAPSLQVATVFLVRDEMTWRERADGSRVELSTDVGLLLQCLDGTDLLVLADDSEAAFVQVVHLRTKEQVDWWFSTNGVRHTWLFDYSPEGPEFLVTRRTAVPLDSV